MRNQAWLAGAIVSLFAACGDDVGPVHLDAATVSAAPDGGGGVDGAVASSAGFSSSACKSETARKASLAHLRTLKVIDDEAGLNGLRCLAWEGLGTDGVKVDLYNFDAECAAAWNGDGAAAADGTLALQVDNPACLPSRCGICLYDWSFDLSVNLPADQSVAVDLAISSCAGQGSASHRLLAIGPEAKGIRCTLASYGALNWQATAAGTCGKAGMPCVGSLLCGTGSFASTGTCADGLVCDSSAAVNEPVCFVPCSTAADCPRADVYTCQAGLCRPSP